MSYTYFFVKRLTQSAILPQRGSKQAAGYDLFADENLTIQPCRYDNETKLLSIGQALISTSIAIKIPDGYYARIASRSGLAVKSYLEVGAGVVDSDYRGEVKVLLRNLGSIPYEVKQGTRIAQLIIEKITTPEVEEVIDLDVTDRGEGGFGSTGLSNLQFIE